MKFLCLLLGLFCIISCSNSDVKTVATPPLEKEQKVTLSKQKSACDFTVAAFQCDSIPDRVIGDSCAQVWKNTWLEMLQLHLPKRKITVLGDAALLRSVSRVAIDQLGAQQPEWNGFRVYFAKQDTTDAALRHIPDLILVNANNCKDDTLSSDSVLLAMADNTHTFVGKQKASAFIQQWNTTANSAAFNPTAIKAYSFNRKDMESAAQMLGSAAAVTLQFYFGAHQIKPELEENVIDLILTYKNQAGQFGKQLDFAQPCPELCDTLSLFYNAARLKNG